MAEKPINEMSDTEIEAELWSHGIDINDTYRRLQRVLGLVRGLRDAEADRYALLSAAGNVYRVIREEVSLEDVSSDFALAVNALAEAIAKAEGRR